MVAEQCATACYGFPQCQTSFFLLPMTRFKTSPFYDTHLLVIMVTAWVVVPATAYTQTGHRVGSVPVDIDSLLNEYSVNGSVSILDYKHNRWFFSDSADARQETLPASTFKIINSCIALETGAVKNEQELIKWDGEEKTFFGTPIPAWNRDTYLENAFKNSTVWFYEELAKRIGRNTYKYYLSKANYGNSDLSHDNTDFWNYGDFAISPVNQIQFLRNLYEEKLPFSDYTFKTVKEIMVSEKTSVYTTRGKTGWTKKDGIDIGWWVGYMETENNVYFFATRLSKNVDDENPRFSRSRTEITEAILKKILQK